jgi:hypothetical protein
VTVWVAPVILYYVLHVLKTRPAARWAVERCEFLAYGCMLFGIVLNSGLRTRFIYFRLCSRICG